MSNDSIKEQDKALQRVNEILYGQCIEVEKHADWTNLYEQVDSILLQGRSTIATLRLVADTLNPENLAEVLWGIQDRLEQALALHRRMYDIDRGFPGYPNEDGKYQKAEAA